MVGYSASALSASLNTEVNRHMYMLCMIQRPVICLVIMSFFFLNPIQTFEILSELKSNNENLCSVTKSIILSIIHFYPKTQWADVITWQNLPIKQDSYLHANVGPKKCCNMQMISHKQKNHWHKQGDTEISSACCCSLINQGIFSEICVLIQIQWFWPI